MVCEWDFDNDRLLIYSFNYNIIHVFVYKLRIVLLTTKIFMSDSGSVNGVFHRAASGLSSLSSDNKGQVGMAGLRAIRCFSAKRDL